MKIIITDDEQPARERILRMLDGIPGLQVVGEATTGREAIAAVRKLQPDAMFIDVEMPDCSGVEAVRELQQDWCPRIVFTTAHTQPAVEAFDLDASDYLLKPFSRSRLLAAVERIRADLSNSHPPFPAPETAAHAPRDRFLIRNGKNYQVVPTDDILSVKAAANYVVIRTAETKHIMRRTLQQFAAELSPRRFHRTSRSTIVNLQAVREIKASPSGNSHNLLLSDGSELPLTTGLRDLEARLADLN